MKITLSIFFLFLVMNFSYCQTPNLYFKGAIKENRSKFYNTIVEKSILKNARLPLTDSTEENWQSAFSSIELLNYKNPLIDSKIKAFFPIISKRSVSFQRSFLQLIYSKYPVVFNNDVKKIFDTAQNLKLKAMAAEYLLLPINKAVFAKKIFDDLEAKAKADTLLKKNPFIIQPAINARIALGFAKETPAQRSMNLLKYIPAFFEDEYLPNNTIVFSFQRKNRNYPGLAIVRNRNGSFIKNNDSSIFNVPQLARSLCNLPSYLTNGSTPQGVFRMSGNEVSTLAFIGPTQNIQLMLPVEATKQHYFQDSSITDNDWSITDYSKILPRTWRNNTMLYETYFAGLAGRTEIIAHGTTVNPEYYKGTTFYPHTPTEGCLCTKEIWSKVDGSRMESNQQKLVDAVNVAGGANGYLIVIELEDVQRPVVLKDIEIYLKISKKL